MHLAFLDPLLSSSRRHMKVMNIVKVYKGHEGILRFSPTKRFIGPPYISSLNFSMINSIALL